MKPDRITFLFGSGADSCCAQELRSGADFSKSILRNAYKDIIVKVAGEEYANYSLVYRSSTKVYIQTICDNPEEARKALGDHEIVEACLQYNMFGKDGLKKLHKYNSHDNISSKCRDWYKYINNPEEETQKIADFFLHHAEFFDALDGKFNSLRRIDQKNKSYKRVMNAYWTVYLFMIDCLYGDKIKKINNRAELYTLLSEPYSVHMNEKTYYSLASQIESNIATTNYTELVNAAKHSPEQKVVFLHGKMTWFEDPKKLAVYDYTVPAEREKLERAEDSFPFILIPSGVKPLICPRQIRMFSDFTSFLDESNELCVIGYRFNSEDNHINSIIGEWLQKSGRRLVFFNYKRETNTDVLFTTWLQGIHFEKIDGKEILADAKKCFDRINEIAGFVEITIDAENSVDVFEKYIDWRK